MRAGRLIHRLTIEVLTEAKGTMGGTSKTWATFATIWGELTHTSGKELIAAGQVQSEISAIALIRYHSGITAKMRLVYDGDVYDIEAALPVKGRKRDMELILSQGLNDG